ncbi:MAG: bifunctional DNA primase/polymerase [Clostridiales Family XIII bacterium]|nr:bifunctional DNA primase/polymerase [Clostridia bacterium]MDY3011495.1 bifunctional DNA primase/polymerase [Clostridiales Family XIII bacterium]
MTENKMLESALTYASMGLAVFPLKFKGKEPATPDGFKSATTDPERIKAWWGKPPGDKNNIGIATGQISGSLIVIDIDKDPEKGIDGYESLLDWTNQYGALPETAMTITGRGGNHLLYRAKAPERSRTNLYPGIDIRADGGYIVAPPSVHPNGQLYEWEQELDEYGITPVNDTVSTFLHPLEDLDRPALEMPEMIPSGERNASLFKLACSLRDKGLSESAIATAVKEENRAKCVPPLGDREINILIGSAMKYEPEHRYTTTTENGVIKAVKEKKDPPPLEMYTAADLMKMDLRPPRYIVKDLLPVGVCILAAPSKMGKSWLVLDLGLAVAAGQPFMGFPTNKCEVVYFALEDSWARLKGRLKKLTGSETAPEGLTLVTKCEPIQNGFLQQIEQVIKGKPNVGLIIVDTLQKVKPPSDKNKTAYEQDYEVFSEISKLAIKHDISIMFLHHTRKGNGFNTDPFENILGSTALQGATDVMFIIKKEKRTDEEAIFYATGRDISPEELAVKFNKQSCRWENLGDAGTIDQLRAELEYRNHPAIVTLKAKLEEIKNDPNVPIKEYVVRAKDFRDDVIEHTGQVIGTSERNFMTEVSRFDAYLLKDKIRHIVPENNTTHKKISARWHRYKSIQ